MIGTSLEKAMNGRTSMVVDEPIGNVEENLQEANVTEL